MGGGNHCQVSSLHKKGTTESKFGKRVVYPRNHVNNLQDYPKPRKGATRGCGGGSAAAGAATAGACAGACAGGSGRACTCAGAGRACARAGGAGCACAGCAGRACAGACAGGDGRGSAAGGNLCDTILFGSPEHTQSKGTPCATGPPSSHMDWSEKAKTACLGVDSPLSSRGCSITMALWGFNLPFLFHSFQPFFPNTGRSP